MKTDDQECTMDDSHSYDSPLNRTKSNDSSVSEYHQHRMHQFNQMLAKFKEQQMQLVGQHVAQVQKNRKRYLVVVVIVVCLMLLPMYLLYCQVQKLGFRVRELEYRQKQLVDQVKDLQKVVAEYNQMSETMEHSLSDMNQEILDLHMSELLKEEKSMFILQKYTSSFYFSIDQNNPHFKTNFELVERTVRKKTGEEVMFYASQAIPSNGVYYLKIEIEQTELGMISIGIMPRSKKDVACVYCNSTEIYYIYCKNGKIYNGQQYKLVNRSKKSKLDSIKSGDTVSMFVDNKNGQVLWYVNSKYAGSQNIKQTHKEWYPFLQMTTRRDQIKFLE